jgi:AcrR family transcriptional regulator
MQSMSLEERRLRADAERNRRRLLDAAQVLFRERGLDVGVAEIAQRAGVGRGTLFRNFPSKEALIVAIVGERMAEATSRGRALLDEPDPATALFTFLEEMAGAQQLDRALVEAVADTLLCNPEIRAAHVEVVGALDALLRRAQAAGAVRQDVSALDVLMLMKGVCQAVSAYSHIDPDIVRRQLDLVLASLRITSAEQPLRGRAPTLEDLERAFPAAAQPTDAATPRA